MADDLLTASIADLDGVLLSATAGTGGNDFTFVNNGDIFLYIANGSAGSLDITFQAVGATEGGVDFEDKVVAIGAGAARLFSSLEVKSLRVGSTKLTRILLPDGSETDISVQAFKFVSGK